MSPSATTARERARVGRLLPRARAPISPCSHRSSPETSARASLLAAGRARAVRRRPPRPRRRADAGADALAEPALLRVLRDDGIGSGDPRRAPVAGLNQVGILWRTSPALQELEEVTLDWLAQLLGLPSACTGTSRTRLRPARSRRSRSLARAPGRASSLCSEHAHSAVDKAAQAARARAAQGAGRRRVPAASGSARPRRRLRGLSRRSGRPARCDRPDSGDRRRVRGGGRLAPRGRGLRRLGRGLPGAPAAFAGWERADSIVVNPHKWLGVPMDCSTLWTRRPDDFRRAFSLVPEFLRSADDVVNLSEHAIPLGRRFRALKLWAVLRCYGREGLAGADPRARSPRRAVRGVGAGRAGLGGRGAASLLARLLPPRRAPTRRTSGCSSG